MRTRPLRLCLILAALVLLGGCKEKLYSGLTERQANTMLSALLNGGVDTVKKAEPKGTFGILVDKSDLAVAVDLLNAEGLPGERFVDMAEMYKKEGLISSPMEERVRYMFVLSQSIAETLTNIDGILTARVHIALPEKDSFTGELEPSSASVFIKYRRDYNFDDVRSEIKRIVENSIEGLSYDRIAIFMSPSKDKVAPADEDVGTALVAFGPFAMTRESVHAMKLALLFVLVTFTVLGAAIAWLVWKLGLVNVLRERARLVLERRRSATASADGTAAGVPDASGAAADPSAERPALGRLRSIATFKKSA